MKNFTLTFFMILLMISGSFAQVKSTGTVSLISGMTAKIDLDNGTTTATLTLTGPSDRWFGLTFGNFPTDAEVGGESGMANGNDIVYYNGTTLVDCKQVGIGDTPSVDAVNNWTLTSDEVFGTTRTIVATRAFNTADSDDFTFDFADTQLDFASARRSTASYSFSAHGGNRGVFPNNQLSTVLGLADHSLDAATIYPNPSKGNFVVQTHTAIEKINIYTQTGAFIKSIEVGKTSQSEVNINGLQTGVYLIELQSNTEKSWKKVIVE